MVTSIRKFVCKRCGKNATDKQGGAEVTDKTTGVKKIYENIDLCDRCFKITCKEARQFNMIQELLQKGILKEDQLKQFQLDRKFRNKIVQEHFVKKSGWLKERNLQLKLELLNKKVSE